MPSASKALIPDPGPNAGPKMALCTPLQRRFVMALLELGDLRHSAAARMAGCTGSTDNSLAVSAYGLFHNPKVQAALHEQALTRLAAGKIMAVSQLLIMANSSTNESVRLKALLAIMNRTGMHEISERRLEVIDINSTLEEDLDQLAILAKQSGQPLAPEWQRLVDARADRRKKKNTQERIDEENTYLSIEYRDPDADILEVEYDDEQLD